MLISVITPFHKEIDMISETVSSVCGQSWIGPDTQIEICIGNDGPFSDDDILERIQPEMRDCVRVARNQGPKGPGGARNTAIDLAKGNLLAFLDADDLWKPEKLALQVPAFTKGITFSATGYEMDTGGTPILPPESIATALEVFLRLGLGTSTVILSRALVGETRFRNLRFSQDIDFWYRIAAKPDFAFARLTDSLTVYSTGGSTRNKLDQAKSLWHVLRINDISLSQRLRVMRRYAVRGVYNHYIKPRSAKRG